MRIGRWGFGDICRFRLDRSDQSGSHISLNGTSVESKYLLLGESILLSLTLLVMASLERQSKKELFSLDSFQGWRERRSAVI